MGVLAFSDRQDGRAPPRIAPGRSIQGKWPAPSSTSTDAAGPIASAVSVDALTGIGLDAPCTNSVGTAAPASRAARPGSSSCSDANVAAYASSEHSRSGKAGAAEGSAKYAGQSSCIDSLRSAVGAPARHRLRFQVLDSSERARRRPAHHLGVELGLPAVPDAAERVDHERGGEPLRVLREQVQQQVPAPGVSGDDRALPSEAVEHGDDICDLGGQVVGCAGGRRRHPALLVHRHEISVRELVHQRREIPPGQSRAAVQQQDGVAPTRGRTA